MIHVSVCIGSACHIRGSYNVIQMFQQMIEEYKLHDKINFEAAFCMKKCQTNGVSVCVEGKYYDVLPETAKEFFQKDILPIVN